MANQFLRRDQHVADRLISQCSITVTLKRGEDETEDVAASVDASEYDLDDGSGVVDRWRSRDFKILAADYVIDGVAVLPQRGDLILETIDGTDYTREVSSPPGSRHYDDDQHGVMFRVHTWQREAE